MLSKNMSPAVFTQVKTIYDKHYAAMIAELRSRRLRSGMTQQNAAAKIGLSRHWIRKIEKCELRLDVLHFVLLCRVVGVRAEKMLRHLTKEESSPEEDFFYVFRPFEYCADSF